MLPFVIDKGDLPFTKGDYVFIPGIKQAVKDKNNDIKAYAVKADGLHEFILHLGDLTDEEREIILKGCPINYNAV